MSSQWIKCSDRLPNLDDDGYSEQVLVVNKLGNKMVDQCNDKGWLSCSEVTHWIPLPKLPNDKTTASIADKLKALQSNPDKEAAHNLADKILCDLLNSLGYTAIVNEFENLEKWYA